MNWKLVSRLAAVIALSSVAPLGCGGEETGAGDEQNVKATANGKVEIFVGEDDQLHFRVVASNGEKLLRSEAYTSRGAVEKGIESAKKNGLESKRYKLAQAEDGLWFYNLVAANGEIIGTSETYSSKSNAQRGMSTLQKVFTKLSQSAPKVTCSLKRLSSVSQGTGKVEVDLGHLDENGYGYSDSLAAYEGSYSFDVGVEDGSVNVIFYENEHVQDEVGSFGCEMPKIVRGTTFCNEPIEIDRNLGTDAEESDTVHAFDFGCSID